MTISWASPLVSVISGMPASAGRTGGATAMTPAPTRAMPTAIGLSCMTIYLLAEISEGVGDVVEHRAGELGQCRAELGETGVDRGGDRNVVRAENSLVHSPRGLL